MTMGTSCARTSCYTWKYFQICYGQCKEWPHPRTLGTKLGWEEINLVKIEALKVF